jgi:hypothetical protein
MGDGRIIYLDANSLPASEKVFSEVISFKNVDKPFLHSLIDILMM